jgi:hypothetical protein
LAESLAWRDERYSQLMGLVRKLVAERGIEPPQIDEPRPFDARAPERLDLSGVGAVVFAAGFRPDYRSWLPWPEAFDELGFPLQRDGASTVILRLHFLGVHFLRKRKSSLLVGVGEGGTSLSCGCAGLNDSERLDEHRTLSGIRAATESLRSFPVPKDSLQRSTAAATGVPEREDLEPFRLCDHAVIDIVMNSHEVQTPNAGEGDVPRVPRE